MLLHVKYQPIGTLPLHLNNIFDFIALIKLSKHKRKCMLYSKSGCKSGWMLDRPELIEVLSKVGSLVLSILFFTSAALD